MARWRLSIGILLAAALAACAEPATYTRSGASPEVTRADLESCQTAARNETWNYGPFFGAGVYGGRPGGFYWGGGAGVFLWQQRLDMDRSYSQDRLTDFCMRNKGYALTPVQPPAPSQR